MIAISDLANAVKPSATLAAGAKARALKASGITVYDYSLGEPDYTTPAHICAAAEAAMKAGHTHYTAANGIPELRKAVAKYYGQKYGLTCTAEQVLISNGAKHSIHNALAAVCNPGDEVIIPTPYWVSYSDLVAMTGAKVVLVETTAASGFKMTPAQLQAAITPKTKLLMLNSPSNPTGTVYTKAELEALVDVLVPTNVAILSDEIYEHLTFGGVTPTCVATLRPEIRDRVITISGASKGYAMTGWRMGWTVATEPVIKAMGNIQSQQAGCPCSISQYAALAALEGQQECVEEMRVEFEARRDLVCAKLAAMPGITFPKPDGAFYVFFDITAFYGKTVGNITITDSLTFCTAALEQAHVNLVAGVAFGAEGFARMSYASSREQLEKGLEKLAAWLPK
ncbi:pyridoxal phosphate-dependent aminotransferase [Tuwongella immobilis]|uniref:Aminotransferase n=1 Tax=Tuwongella immobilis TaxID=692036 RepID=A0A6C2YW31_9BACT|nr:pyridoxal phosphate-dependent aminotransferase [Tuwongella immobilis]VIP05072.1 aspartate aminotransferase : Aspartate aminotransferase OS=uncultured planctomycete GN=HGMM_F11G08C24 PE=3 SV=1: Aminotran_1_2 [Tuwongella immobilis]VTS07500.1 aspartate aminotransferase : Aspartate aminotransferase OS=uncultured planctomycete GN=HGMM_F11G08C24 PE=3 SV=1: Aminotran_1_2 [Tuwongella immobilis]